MEDFSILADNYSEAGHKMDKFLSDQPEDQQSYYDILEDDNLSQTEKIEQIIELFDYVVVDEDRMYSYFPEGGSVKEFVTYLVMS